MTLLVAHGGVWWEDVRRNEVGVPRHYIYSDHRDLGDLDDQLVQ